MVKTKFSVFFSKNGQGLFFYVCETSLTFIIIAIKGKKNTNRHILC